VATTTRKLDIEEFARRVERLCDFFLARISEDEGRDGSSDVRVLEDLKEEAADILVYYTTTSETFKGLDDFMKGFDSRPEEDKQKEL
jgi:hypothetical protein